MSTTDPERTEPSQRLFTTSQLSRILDVPPARLRAWVRQGLLEPAEVVGRLAFFDFRQITVARALKELTHRGVGTRRIRKSLAELRAWKPATASGVAQLEALAGGGPLVVRTDEGSWAETTGQLRLGLEETEEEGALLVPGAAPVPEDWFERGVVEEAEGRSEEAVAAYGRAIALRGPHAEVCFNLGNALYALGRTPEAAACFREATTLESDYVEAWNNLGNALSALGEHAEAVRAFERALAIAPAYADGHYNLADTLAQVGRLDDAVRHWKTYLGLDPDSAWADEARRRLEAAEHEPTT